MNFHTSGMHLEDSLKEGVDLRGGTTDYSNLGNHPNLREGRVAVKVTDSPHPPCEEFCLLGTLFDAVHTGSDTPLGVLHVH